MNRTAIIASFALASLVLVVTLTKLVDIDWKKAIFPAKYYEDSAQTSFIVYRRFADVRRRLMQEDLTTNLVQAQGGRVLGKKNGGFRVNGPIKDLQITLLRDFTVAISNKYYGQMVLCMQQRITIEKTKIQSEVTLVSPMGSLEHYLNKTTITEGSNGCIVECQTAIGITEHVPVSYDARVRKELKETLNKGIALFQDAFVRVVD